MFTIFKWVTSPLCRDIQLAACLAIALAIGIGCVGFYNLKDTKDIFALMSVLATALLSFLLYLANAGNARTGVATVFESEIRNICNVMWTFGLGAMSQHFVITNWLQMKEYLTSREEDYVETFSGNIDKIATLPDDLVFEITAFFTYLKASRDAVLVLEYWDPHTPNARRLQDVERIANHLRNCLLRAQAALHQFDAHRSKGDLLRIYGMIKNLTAFLGPNLVDLDAKLAPAIPGGDPIAS